MKFILAVVLVAIVSCSYGARIAGDPKEAILNLIEEKCRSNAHNSVAFRDLMNGAETYMHCVENAMGDSPPNPLTEHSTFCGLPWASDYYTCLNSFANKVTPCLDEEEAYFPNFVLTAFNASYDEFCGKNGVERMTALVNDIESSTCLTTHLSPSIIQHRCIDSLNIYKNIENELFTIKKTDLCSDLRSFKGCIIQLLKDRCNEDHTDTVDFMIDPYIAAC